MNDRRRRRAAGSAALAVACVWLLAPPASAERYTLDEAVRLAIAGSPVLALSRAQTDEKDAKVREAESGFYPQIEAQGGYLYRSEVPAIQLHIDTPLGAFDRTFRTGKNDNWQVKGVLTQTLFAGGALYYGRRAALADAEATRETTAQIRNDLVANVTRAYLGLQLAQESRQVLAASLDNAREHLADVRTRLAAGWASRADELKAEVQERQILSDLSRAAEATERARAALRVLMCLPETAEVETIGELTPTAAGPAEEDVHAAAYRDRPELAALDARRTAAADLVRVARAGWLPKLQVQGAYNYEKPFLFEEEGEDYFSVGVGASLPIFDGLRAHSRMDQARAQIRQAEAGWRAQQSQIQAEVDDALARRKEAQDRVVASAENVELAAEALRMTRDGYREGVATNLDVLDANLRLLQARLAHLQAIYDEESAKNDLYRACGRYAAQGD